MKKEHTYEPPSVQVFEFEPEGCLCSSGFEPDAHNDVSTSHQMSNNSWGVRLWEDDKEE